MTVTIRAAAVGFALVLANSVPVSAGTITNGFTFSVADCYVGACGVGTHFHSSTGGDFGNPAGKAEVGRYYTEEVRGLSEYNLAGLATASSAFVTFNVYNDGGLFAGSNDFPFDGTINITSYAGNNAEDLSDFQAPAVSFVGSFNTSGLAVGQTLSFDILSIFNAAIANGDQSLGIRLAAVPLPDSGAWTFDTFRLTTDNQTSVVPIPAAFPLFLSALVSLGFVRRSHKNSVS